MGRVGGESGLGLGGKGRIRYSVGKGSGAAEVHHIAEGHPSSEGEEETVEAPRMLVLVQLQPQIGSNLQDDDTNDGRSRAKIALGLVSIGPVSAARLAAAAAAAAAATAR